MHAVCTHMLRTFDLDKEDTCTPAMINELVANIGWVICATCHTLLGSSPGAAIFDRDMLFGIPYLPDWTEIGRQGQAHVNKI